MGNVPQEFEQFRTVSDADAAELFGVPLREWRAFVDEHGLALRRGLGTRRHTAAHLKTAQLLLTRPPRCSSSTDTPPGSTGSAARTTASPLTEVLELAAERRRRRS